MDALSTTVKPTWGGSLVLLAGCVAGQFINSTLEAPHQTAQLLAYILLGCITVSVLLDWRKGLRNLIRTDIFALLALFFLLYFEFFFPQPLFELNVTPIDAKFAISITLLGFAALVIGRHVTFGGGHLLDYVGKVHLRPMDYPLMLFAAFIIANLYMWMSVKFNPADWFSGLMLGRFSRPWARGHLGDASALLSELALLGYVIPPLTGIILARWRDYRIPVIALVALCFLCQCFVAFSDGTRNVLAVYLAGFLGGYFIVQKMISLRRLILVCGAVTGIFLVLANYMLDFREVGLGRYIEEKRYSSTYKEFDNQYLGGFGAGSEGYFVDSNLYNISLLAAAFPNVYDYLGWNFPYVALTKPVPRVFWPSKPIGLRIEMAEAVGIEGMSISSTFVGESYISFGIPGVVCAGLLLGAFCAWWNQLADKLHSPLTLLIYTSGFFCILITMRSMMIFSTALLPAIALLVFSRMLYAHQRN
jgi:oligosaccharide repeat unit polymerase